MNTSYDDFISSLLSFADPVNETDEAEPHTLGLQVEHNLAVNHVRDLLGAGDVLMNNRKIAGDKATIQHATTMRVPAPQNYGRGSTMGLHPSVWKHELPVNKLIEAGYTHKGSAGADDASLMHPKFPNTRVAIHGDFATDAMGNRSSSTAHVMTGRTGGVAN